MGFQANLLIPVNHSQQLWDFIETIDDEVQVFYWQNARPFFYNLSADEKIYGVKMLLKHKRNFSAIEVSSQAVEQIPTALLTEILEQSATEEAIERGNFKTYIIEKIFESLDKRTDIDRSTLLKLEWLYLPIFDSYDIRRKPKLLQEELSSSPEFFIEVLKWVYLPKDKTRLDDERKGLREETVLTRARQAYHLLHSWKKIPGMNPDNSITESELQKWIDTARVLAEKVDRLDVADMQIGQILATYPETVAQWPQEIIFQIIEDINSDSIKRNYSAAMFNKRSFSSRSPFEGGNIERGHAKYFTDLAEKYRNKYPNVSNIFTRLAEGYIWDAKRMDEEAERTRLDY